MKYFLVIFFILIYFCARPDLLYSFDTVPGRTILLAAVIYLVQLNQVLGLLAALAVSQVFDKTTPLMLPVNQAPDLMSIGDHLRPQASHTIPFIKISAQPLGNDPFFNYAWY